MDIDESDLQMLFEMIDVDGSGSIEVAEFIGPLSRWAHDSKTAPRFIKYNLMQSVKMQEDLYDMCEDCFKHLSLQIAKVFAELKGSHGRNNSLEPSDQTNTASIPPARMESDSTSAALRPPSPERQEHVFELHPSREVSLLKDKASDLNRMVLDTQLELSFERVVAQLESSARKLESFAADAASTLNKWSELPVDPKRKERHVDPSTSHNGSKTDVFWALYMDRDKGGRRRTVQGHRATAVNRRSLEVLGSEADDGFSQKSEAEHVAEVMSNPTSRNRMKDL